MGQVSIIGLDLANLVFQAHGADRSGAVVFRKKLRREQVLAFFASQPRCLVAQQEHPADRPTSAMLCVPLELVAHMARGSAKEPSVLA
jgi:transposase